MKHFKTAFPISILLFLPMCLPPGVSAQAMTIIGGSQQARECFTNASLAADLSTVTHTLIEPCSLALDYADLSLQDRAATYANRGILLFRQGRIEAAMRDYDKAMSLTPDRAEVYLNRGNAFFMSQDYARALEDYEHAESLGIRQMHYLHYNKGMTYEKLGNYPVAEREYLAALELEPDWALAESKLARVRARQQQALENPGP